MHVLRVSVIVIWERQQLIIYGWRRDVQFFLYQLMVIVLRQNDDWSEKSLDRSIIRLICGSMD